MRAVRKHTDCTWMLLYIERWLIAPAQLGDGTLVPRKKGTPQGRVISPRQPVAALRFSRIIHDQDEMATIWDFLEV
jgi:retron-type reverse transcriptase